jgi:hypothetical protein
MRKNWNDLSGDLGYRVGLQLTPTLAITAGHAIEVMESEVENWSTFHIVNSFPLWCIWHATPHFSLSGKATLQISELHEYEVSAGANCKFQWGGKKKATKTK